MNKNTFRNTVFTVILAFSLIQCREPKPPSNIVHIPAKTIIFVCEDEKGEEVKCQYDEDCCEHFVCVKELNTQNKTCVHE